jgi:hypothetical protein
VREDGRGSDSDGRVMGHRRAIVTGIEFGIRAFALIGAKSLGWMFRDVIIG